MDKISEPFVGSEDALTEQIIKIYYEVYNELGFGFLESVYCRAMAIALEQRGLDVASEVAIPVSFRGVLVGSFRADLMVERKVIVEAKTCDQVLKAHEAQLLHYLRASTIEVGLVLIFGEVPRFRRLEFRNERKRLMKGAAVHG